jgi:hypothetical protein
MAEGVECDGEDVALVLSIPNTGEGVAHVGDSLSSITSVGVVLVDDDWQ